MENVFENSIQFNEKILEEILIASLKILVSM